MSQCSVTSPGLRVVLYGVVPAPQLEGQRAADVGGVGLHLQLGSGVTAGRLQQGPIGRDGAEGTDQDRRLRAMSQRIV